MGSGEKVGREWGESGEKVRRKCGESEEKVRRKWGESGAVAGVGRKWGESEEKVGREWGGSGSGTFSRSPRASPEASNFVLPAPSPLSPHLFFDKS